MHRKRGCEPSAQYLSEQVCVVQRKRIDQELGVVCVVHHWYIARDALPVLFDSDLGAFNVA